VKIFIATPAPKSARTGNRTTALRWAQMLKQLGHRVTVGTEFGGNSTDVLIALHARRSYSSISRYRADNPNKPLIVALTGTDVYGGIQSNAKSRRALELADRLVILQPMAAEELVGDQADKARVVYQSATLPKRNAVPRKRTFDVCVIGHLRAVKDPFRAALAVRKLPAASRVRVLHVGAALGPAMARAARREMQRNPRYLWLGERPRWQARRLLARCRVMVLSSRVEGGANVVSEAVVASVPILASRIPGSVGLLGEAYPGYFPVGGTLELRELLLRAESDPKFLSGLRKRLVSVSRLFHPAAERRAWKNLLSGVSARRR
jgi:putative glycosyltransferase (TIGR04348 family)